MPFEQHREVPCACEPKAVHQAAVAAIGALGGTLAVRSDEKLRIEANLPKVILGKTLGERTWLACEVRLDGLAVVDAYPLDAVGRKLMFGARKGVTETVVGLFLEHLAKGTARP